MAEFKQVMLISNSNSVNQIIQQLHLSLISFYFVYCCRNIARTYFGLMFLNNLCQFGSGVTIRVVKQTSVAAPEKFCGGIERGNAYLRGLKKMPKLVIFAIFPSDGGGGAEPPTEERMPLISCLMPLP